MARAGALTSGSAGHHRDLTVDRGRQSIVVASSQLTRASIRGTPSVVRLWATVVAMAGEVSWAFGRHSIIRPSMHGGAVVMVLMLRGSPVRAGETTVVRDMSYQAQAKLRKGSKI
jgi:hypothetical protein